MRPGDATARLIRGVLIVSAALPGHAPAQPEEPPTPESVLRKAQELYRSRPTCDRVSIEVEAGGRTSRSWYVVRVDPEPAPPEEGAGLGAPGVRLVSLDLGSLRIVATGGELIAVHTRNDETFYRAAYGERLTSEALAEVMPPVLMPEVDLAAAPALPDAFWPYATGIRWNSIAADPRRRARATAQGGFEGGTVTATFDQHRLTRLVIHNPEQGTRITLAIAPIFPCDPAAAPLDSASRTPLGSLAELRPGTGVLRLGARVPEMPLTDAAGNPAGLRTWLEAPVELAPAPPAERLVLIMTPESGQREQRVLPNVDWEAAAARLGKLRVQTYSARGEAGGPAESPLPLFGYVRVLALEQIGPEALMERLAAEQRQWGRDFAWSTSPASTVGLFARPPEPLVVVLDGRSRLRAAQAVDAQATTDSLLDQIAGMLIETAAELPPE